MRFGNEDEFLLAALEKAPEECACGALRESAAEVWLEKSGKVYDSDLGTVIERAGVEKPKPREKREESLLSSSPESVIIEELLLSRIDPMVRETRKAIFGSEETPFDSLQGAAEWLENQRRAKNRPPFPERQLIELSLLMRRRFQALDFKNFGVAYLKPGESDFFRVVVVNEQLDRLRFTAETISKNTGFHPAVVTSYILAGLPPKLARVTITAPSRVPGWHRDLGMALPQVTVTFRSPDVARRELRSVYRAYRESLPSSKRHRMDPSDQALFGAIADVNRATPKGRRKGSEYYGKIQEKWGNPGINSWVSVKHAKRRLIKRLRARGFSKKDLSKLV